MKALEQLTINSTDEKILALLNIDIPVSQITFEDYFHVYNLVVQNVLLPCRYYDESLWTAVRGGALFTELRPIQEIPIQVTEAVKNLAVAQYWDYRTSWLDLHWNDEERGDPERILYLKSKEDQKGLLVPARNLIGTWGGKTPLYGESFWKKGIMLEQHLILFTKKHELDYLMDK